MPERPRDFDREPPEVKYGLLSMEDYNELSDAMDKQDFPRWAKLAVRLCEDSVPLFAILFLQKNPTPHFWKEWKTIQNVQRLLIRVPRGHGKTDYTTFCTIIHRIAYSVVPGSLHEDPAVLAIFETRPRANDRMLSVRQVFETGGPGGIIGKVFRGAPTFPGGEPTPWADMAIPTIADRFGEWNNSRISLPHPRRLAKSDPNVASITPGEGSVGFQPRIVLADDIVGPKNAASAAKRQALARWWDNAIGPMFKGPTKLFAPHTVFNRDDLNHELGGHDGTYELLELLALDRFPDRDDYIPIRNEKGTIVDIQLTPKGETLKPLWGCPDYAEADCPWRDPTHIDPRAGGTMHRPLKDLLFQWHDKPLVFASQYMHKIQNTDETSIKPWMLRFYCSNPNCKDRCWESVASWHAEWKDWVVDHPDAGLEKDPPTIVLFTSEGVTAKRGDKTVPIKTSVHGWDLGFGQDRTNDRTVCARLHVSEDRRFFVSFDKGRWKHDQVWRKIVLNAVTDPILKPSTVALEVDNQNIYHQEVKRLMGEMNAQGRFRLMPVRRTKEKDIVLHNSGLPIVMGNGFVYVDIHDQDAVMELLAVTPDQSGGHDDCLDALVHSYIWARSGGKPSPGFVGAPLPAR